MAKRRAKRIKLKFPHKPPVLVRPEVLEEAKKKKK